MAAPWSAGGKNDLLAHRPGGLLILAGLRVVAGATAAGVLYYVYPVQVSTIAGLIRNYLVSWSAPLGMTTTESNAAYKTGGPIAPSPPAERAGDWPSYNRTLTSECFSPLTEINTWVFRGRLRHG
jgi:alcohol dehydrogenase (cytochrome c)